MRLQQPFRTVAPTLDGDVLLVLARADRALTGRAVEQASGGSHGGIRRALEHLVAQGVVDREPAGRAYLYRLNRDHLAAPAIEQLASLRLTLLDRLRSAIAAWPVQPAAAVLFGSAARGDMHDGSDLDLLVVRPASTPSDDPDWQAQLAGLARAATRWTGNDARILEVAEGDLARPEPVVTTAAAEGVELHGSLRELLRGAERAGR